MLKLLLLRFWPVFIPILLYLAWLAYARRKNAAQGKKKPGFFDGPWFWAVLASAGFTIVSFLWMGFSSERMEYTPSVMPPHHTTQENIP